MQMIPHLGGIKRLKHTYLLFLHLNIEAYLQRKYQFHHYYFIFLVIWVLCIYEFVALCV